MACTRALAGLVLASVLVGTHAADFEVSTRDWNDSQDGDLSLREAIDVAAGNGRCLTSGEHDHVSGGNWQEIFLSVPGCTVPVGGSRWIGHPALPDNFGDGVADLIKFNNFSGSNILNPAGTLILDSLDTLDGRRPDGVLVVIDGNNAARHGISTEIDNCVECYESNITFRNIVVEDVNGDCFNLGASNSITLEHVVARSCNTGIAVYTSFTGNQPEGFRLRGNGYGRSEVVNNRGDGVYILGNGSTPATNFLITSTLVADNTGTGIHVINVPDVAIGLNDASDGVEVSGHGGDPGILFEGANTAGGRVVGSLVFNNGKGIQLGGGAQQITIGSASDVAQANRIALNGAEGVYLTGATTHANSIEGNLIGALAVGDASSGNGFDGVLINLGAYGNFVHDNVIVDNGAGADANYGWGVQIQDAGSNANEIADNRIGVHANGAAAGNRLGGIRVRYDAAANLIGTAASDAAQHVSGNGGPGIVIDGEGADANLIRRNDIGFTPAGAALGNGADGIVVSGGADNTEIGGSGNQRNRIGSNSGDGIDISNDASDGSKVLGNVIGLSAYNGVARGNAQHGVRIGDGDGGTVQSNLVSGNGWDGIQLAGSASGWQVLGNEVGTDGDPFAPDRIANGFSGLALLSGAINNQIGTVASPNLIVGTGDGIFIADSGTTGNVIEGNNLGTGWGLAPGIAVGNDGRGIHVLASAHGNTLRGNAIGASGFAGIEVAGANNTLIIGNLVGRTRNGYYFGNARGIRVSNASGTQIGGTTVADRNLVISNPTYGIGLLPGTSGTTIRNNHVGVDSDGGTARANGNYGIVLENADNNSLVGNLVSGNNGIGIHLYAGASGNLVASNRIGTTAGASASLGNSGQGATVSGLGSDGNEFFANIVAYNGLEGVLVQNGSIGNSIGAPDDGNQIYGNGGDGIAIRDGSGHRIEGNDLFANDEDEIDLGNDGPTPNDPGDTDTGPNDLQNYPNLVSTYTNISQNLTQVTVSLDSLPLRDYRVTVYGDTDCEQNGRGSGTALLMLSVQTNAAGIGQGTWLGPAITLPRFSASVRDLANGNSSEIGPCFSNVVRLFEDGFEDPFPNRAPVTGNQGETGEYSLHPPM
ncbi:MAG: right-handed parallel beta-helix repeat-containing protein [Xanthomonadales bacterium]|nr:right-handed parallel beta-helix repeat-containing protein [Xanthomonadales bacterium]MBK7144699.1 right-handed parallel beta-helix repeat-containing protein [Xanthomonadales bacterium]